MSEPSNLPALDLSDVEWTAVDRVGIRLQIGDNIIEYDISRVRLAAMMAVGLNIKTVAEETGVLLGATGVGVRVTRRSITERRVD
jgi:hypothetical protein